MIWQAARLTLTIEKIALKHNLTLKDASAFNIQFVGIKPVFIDTLSFEELNPKVPWIAYRQFCQHFLAPLALMSYCDLRSNYLLKDFIDGIPLNMAKIFLPKRSKLNFSILLHIHLHAKSIYKSKSNSVKSNKKFSKLALKGLMDSLENGIKKLQYKN